MIILRCRSFSENKEKTKPFWKSPPPPGLMLGTSILNGLVCANLYKTTSSKTEKALAAGLGAVSLGGGILGEIRFNKLRKNKT